MVVRKVRHPTVSLHRVRLPFFFTCAFIDACSLGTSIPYNPKGCTTASLGVHVPRVFSTFWFFGVFVSDFGSSVLSFIILYLIFVHACIYVK